MSQRVNESMVNESMVNGSRVKGRETKDLLKVAFCLLAACYWLMTTPAWAEVGKVLAPEKRLKKKTLLIAGKRRVYYVLTNRKAAKFPLPGPGRLELLVRQELASSDKNGSFALSVKLEGKRAKKFYRKTRPAKGAHLEDSSNSVISKAETIKLFVSAARHWCTVKLLKSEGGNVYLRAVFTASEVSTKGYVPLSPNDSAQPVVLVQQEQLITYYRATQEKPVVFSVIGPTRLRVLSRLEYNMEMKGRKKYRVRVFEDDKLKHTIILEAQPSPVTTYQNHANGSLVPSRGQDFYVDVPKGRHTYCLALPNSAESTVLFRIFIPRKDLNNSAPMPPKTLEQTPPISESIEGMDEDHLRGPPASHPEPVEWSRPKRRFYSDSTVRLRLEFRHDDNILRYSDHDQAQFRSRLRSDRFGIESIDDVIGIADVSWALTQGVRGGSATTYGLGFRTHRYLSNEISNFDLWQAGIRHKFSRNHSLELRYRWLPRFYVRHLFDRDLNEFRPAFFRINTLSLAYRWRLQPGLWLEFKPSFQFKNYNRAFDERDALSNEWQVGLDYRISSKASLGFDWFWERSKAKAKDADPEPDPDVSYRRFGGQLALNFSGLPLSSQIRVGYGLYWDRFTSRLGSEVDPFHAGRRDVTHTFFARYTFRPFREQTFFLEGRWERSRSSLPPELAAQASESLNYRTFIFSAGMERRF